MTARAKGAEEEVQALKEQIQSLKTNPSQETDSQAKPALDKINTLEDLEALRQEALSAKKWAFDHIGKDYVEIDGKEYEDAQIRSILKESEEYLTERYLNEQGICRRNKLGKTTPLNCFPTSLKAMELTTSNMFKSDILLITKPYSIHYLTEICRRSNYKGMKALRA